jgi:hypothetical protein
MHFKVKQIILWPRRTDLKPRHVTLEVDKVNVISGASRTGKSAIIPIIDYCLAADRCAIPVETIRDSCCWFGILVETAEGEKLFARREPGGQKSTSDMYVTEGETVTIPSGPPEKNTTSDAVKARLDELSGLSRLDFDFEKTGSGFKGRPSFRDLVAFTFQPQNIIANPDVLFFKADTYEHREKLKTIFPYVLKAISAEVLAAQHELESVQRELARKERELNNLQRVSDRWLAELSTWASEAREFGLVDVPIPANAIRADLLGILRQVVTQRRDGLPSADGINEAIGELVSLEEEESGIALQLRNLQRRLSEMSKLTENASRFKDALSIQRDRLAVSKWLHDLEGESHACPVCNNPLQEDKTVPELLKALEEVEASVKRVGAVPASFDREMLRVKQDIGLSIEKLKGIAIRKSEVTSRSEQAQGARFKQSAIARFVGRVEKGLEMHDSLAQDDVLSGEVVELRRQEAHLKKLISKEGVAGRQKRALDTIAVFAGRLLPSLDAERPNDPIELSITDLMVKVRGEQREDYLWEIGSGANWLSYHIAVSLALQQFFFESKPSPVPSFLIYDQPSQVYFPRRLARLRSKKEEDDPALTDEDIEAVRKVFATIASVVKESGGALQTLILDHAGPDVWQDIPGVHLVEEWRQGEKLVPASWLS